MNTDLNQTVVTLEELVKALEVDKNDLLTAVKAASDKVTSLEGELATKVKEFETKIATLEGQLLTPENEKRLEDFLGRLRALKSHVV